MIPCSEDFLKALYTPVKEIYLKIELYDSNNNYLDEISKSVTTNDIGSISVDRNRPVRRSFSFSLSNKNGEYTWGETNLIWIDKRVKVYIGLKLRNGEIEYIPQGVFLISETSDSHTKDSNIVTLSGQDKAYLFTDKRGKFVNELVIEKGANIADAIKTIATGNNETQFLFDEVTEIVPYELTYSANDNRWNAMQELAELAKCEIFYDVNGYLRLKKIETNIDLEPTVWTYKYGDNTDIFYAGNIRKFDETDLANHIRVIASSAQSQTIIYDLVVDENDPLWANSPYSIQKIGRIVYLHNDGNPDPLLSTEDDCKWRAKYELMKRLGYSEKVNVYLAPNWVHDTSDVIEIFDSTNNLQGKYRIDSFQLPIKPDLVDVNCVKYRQVITNWDYI